MLLVCAYSLVLTIVVYLMTFKLKKRNRLITATALFLGLPFLLIVYITIIGDNPYTGSIEYDPSGKPKAPIPPSK